MNVGDVNYYTHSSKTKCVFVDNKELPLISIDIWCKAGSSFEEVDKNGTAHFLEHMIFRSLYFWTIHKYFCSFKFYSSDWNNYG